MSTEQHPLVRHLHKTGETITSFAKRNNISRTHLYRVLDGEPTTTSLLERLADSTGGKVGVADFVKVRERVRKAEVAQ